MENKSEVKPSEFLAIELNGLIDRYSKDRNRHKKSALVVKIITSILASITMVLLGWEGVGENKELFNNLALTANALISIFAAYDAFFEPRKLWIRETVTLSKLKDVKRKLGYDIAKGDIEDGKLDDYEKSINEILETSLVDWQKEKSI